MVNFASAGFAQHIFKNGLSDLSTFSLQFYILSTNSKAASDFERCNGSIHNKMTHACPFDCLLRMRWAGQFKLM
jgi:hypothetical protein